MLSQAPSGYGFADGQTDNTAAFTAALNAVPNGGIVWIPLGEYVFRGSLTMPKATSLVGTFETVPSHAIGQGEKWAVDGSILMPYANRNNPGGAPFITMAEDCTIRGVVFIYPEQVQNAAPVVSQLAGDARLTIHNQ
jgi:hypothetical protein